MYCMSMYFMSWSCMSWYCTSWYCTSWNRVSQNRVSHACPGSFCRTSAGRAGGRRPGRSAFHGTNRRWIMSCEHHHGAGEAPAAAFDSNLRIAHQRHSLAKARGPPNRQTRGIRSALIRSSSAWRRPCRRPSLTPCDRGSRGPDPCWCAGAEGESADGFALPFRRWDEGDLLAATAAANGRSSRRRDEYRWRRSKRVDHGPSSGCQCSAPLRPRISPGNGMRNGPAARAPRGDRRVRRAAAVRLLGQPSEGGRSISADQMVAALPPAAASLSIAEAENALADTCSETPAMSPSPRTLTG
jgi:hypothetical protein